MVHIKLNFDPDLRTKMGVAARQKILKKYTAKKVVDAYLAVYERLM